MSAKISTENRDSNRLFLPALGFSVFSVWLITVTFQLLLIDIAHTFQVNVGTAGLVAAVGATSGIVAGLLLSVLSVRFNHKLFLMIGLAFTCLSSLGFFLAPTFDFVLIINIGVGTGIAMVSSMVYSFIGEFYPLEKRGRAIGWIVASSTLAFVVGAPVVGIIAAVGSWRLTMIWLALPFALVSLILAFIAIPNKSVENQFIQKEPFFAGCKQTFKNRSAVATLFVTTLTVAEAGVAFYSISFFRSNFAISIEEGAFVVLVGNVLLALGGLAAGLFVNRVGRKHLGTFSCLVAALLTVTFTFMPDFTLSWGLNALRFWFAGMASTALGSLVIEQVPKFRATMTSLNTVSVNIGILTASVAGGLAINLYNYQTMSLILGSLGVAGTVLWISLVRDPYKDQKTKNR
ncbi:MAG: MFS transporter [Chloroflexi bacterium]|nr:MFS transporter [Chloroflexota bacterium]